MRKHARRRQGGASLTEFAITAPLFMALIYGSLYLTDLGTFKLKAQEISRFGAWAFTQHPLSNYESDNFEHNKLWNEARDAVSADLADVYFDLDGAYDRRLPVPGAWSTTISAQYTPPTAHDLRNRQVQRLPSWAQLEWAQPLSTIGVVLNMLGFGTGIESFLSGPFQRLRLHHRGQVTARANVILLPPVRPEQARQMVAMASVGGQRDADLTRWLPAGRPLRDTGGGRIETTLIADSWKVHEGFSAHPGRNSGYAHIVTEVSDKGIEALPAGPILAFFTGINQRLRRVPSGLMALIGFAPDDPASHLVSRPYVQDRRERPHFSGAVQPGSGQVDIFRYTGAPRPQESSAVTNFETGPLFEDAEGDSRGYLESLNERGPNFMGCRGSQVRGCWE